MQQELITQELSTQEITIMENKKNDATSAQTPKKKKSNWMMISLAVLLAALLGEMVYYMSIDSQKPKSQVAEQVADDDSIQASDDFMAQEPAQGLDEEETAQVGSDNDASEPEHHASATASNASRQSASATRTPGTTTARTAAAQQTPKAAPAPASTPNNNQQLAQAQSDDYLNYESQGTIVTPIEDRSRSYPPNFNRPVKNQGTYHRGYQPDGNQGYGNHNPGRYNIYSRRFPNR